jgi:hypothetical protein
MKKNSVVLPQMWSTNTTTGANSMGCTINSMKQVQAQHNACTKNSTQQGQANKNKCKQTQCMHKQPNTTSASTTQCKHKDNSVSTQQVYNSSVSGLVVRQQDAL